MKKLLLLLCLLITISNVAQIQKLSALSSARFLDSRIIYDDNSEDVYGYFLLYQKDVKSSTEIELEAILLDKNLNKVGAKIFTIPHVSYWVYKGVPEITFVQKRGNQLLVNITEMPSQYYGGIFYTYGFAELRILDLKTFDIKPLIKNNLDINVTKKMADVNLKRPTKNGFLTYNVNIDDAMGQNNKYLKKITEFKFFDNDLKEKWTFKYNQDPNSKSYSVYTFSTEDKNDMVFYKRFYEKKSDEFPDETIEFIDANTGLSKFNYSIKGNVLVKRIFFTKDKVIIYSMECLANKKDLFKYDKITGLQKIVLDRTTGKEISYNKMEWSALGTNFETNEFGESKKGEYLQFLSFKYNDKTGKTAIFAEGYKPNRNSKILDAYLLELDEKMKVTQFTVVPKFRNKIDNVTAFGEVLEGYDAFDFLYSQSLPNNDGVVFYYVDNEKGTDQGRRKNNFVLGIVTYVDGKFDQQKITLKTKEGRIVPLKAKQGYILLRETSKTDTELRLEKINY